MRPTVLLVALAALSLSACSPESDKSAENKKDAAGPIQPVATPAPSGSYKLDKAHASLIFRVSHMGFSNYTARFKRFDAKLDLDTARPANSKLEVVVDATSLETDFPDPKVVDFNAQLQNEQWLGTAKFPEMTYRSTAIGMTSPNTALVTGDLTLHGVTKPVILTATFNGGYPGMELDPNARIGFSAKATLKRSEFGIAAGIPPPGTNMGVSDDVEIIVEAEFSGPAWTKPAP
ncbi:MAG: YceI family protein [Rhodospirillaceae bacterium]|nr:YceI family protein [Rhodospirillaceae bacterium]